MPAAPPARMSPVAFVPAARARAILVSSPHSGRYYPPHFLANSRLDGIAIRKSEDAFVDELLADAPAAGAHVLAAVYPRAYVDVNRPPDELDPTMFSDSLPPHIVTHSPRLAAGLGTIPRQVGERAEIYAEPLRYGEAEERLSAVYEPFHAALRERLRQTQREGGGMALLLDIHSMPSASRPVRHTALEDGTEAARPDFVLGNRFGEASAPALARYVAQHLRDRDCKVAHNQPYAGGYITEHYGKPQAGVHALQIEINRACYMDEARLVPHGGFATMRALLADLIGALAQDWRALVPAPKSLRAAE